jgi:hypothetical protein
MKRAIAILIMAASVAAAQTNRTATEAYATWKAAQAYTNAKVYADSAVGAFATTGALATAVSAGTVTGVQSNQLAAWVAASNAVITGAAAGATALQAEADTLQSVAARGGFAGTEEITPLRVNAQRFGDGAGLEATGTGFAAFGPNSGQVASGNQWGAYGNSAGSAAIGDNWGAYGYAAGSGTIGSEWGAYGRGVGQFAEHENSHAFGRYAGRTARGNNRLYLDVYAADPNYPAGGSTNDTVFMDSDGKLYLGGGAARAENPSAGGVLRGSWNGTLALASGSTVATATAGNEPVTLDQALSLLESSSTVYLSPVAYAGAQAGVTNRTLAATYSNTAWTVVYSGAVTNNQYLFSFTAPSNLVTSVLAGNQTANLYMTHAGGGGSTLTCKMEGYIFDPATATSVDYAETAATFSVAKSATLPATPTTPVAIIPAATNLTGDLRYQIRIKAIAVNSVTSVTMWGGGTSISSVSFPVADSVVLGSRGATAIKDSLGNSGTYDSSVRTLTMPPLDHKVGIASGSVATNLWAGPAASQSVTNANTIYFTW